MKETPRKIGGDNNKRGNRYEDFFVLFRLIQFAPRVISGGAMIRLKEQAGSPVDDLLLEEPEAFHYHQLKADKSITWGESAQKLEREFLAQKAECESVQQPFKLMLVVRDEGRKQSLAEKMPEALTSCTTVFQFPELARPSDLALRRDILGETLKEIRASRADSVTEDQHIVRAFHIAWVDHEPDTEGFCVLGGVIDKINEWRIGRLRHDWDNRPEEWGEAEKILASIPGLHWWADRGYFEWEYPPTDRGLCPEPCTSEGFHRFLHRLIERKPTSFVEFERLLP